MSGAQSPPIFFEEEAEEKLLEVNFIILTVERFESDGLADESPANGAQAAVDFDAAFLPDFARQPGGRIKTGSRRLPGARAGLVKLRGRTQVETFVRAQDIVFLLPDGKTALLSAEVGGGRVGGVGFENPMHLFMGAIVLGMARAGKLDPDAEAQPPDAQGGEIPGTQAGKRDAVVDPNDARETPFLKEALKDRPDLRIAEGGDGLDAENEAGSQITDGQWFAAAPVGGPKPAFEIQRPDVVGGGWDRQLGS
jgi:hypothetical protein